MLALAPHADPGTVVRRLSDESVAHARRSAGLESDAITRELRAQFPLRRAFTSHPAPHDVG
ncbi:hypothetical protein Sliba_79460 [Streptomyces nigrescens]|uniref:Uncharacterized protein n=1 Tax=Streptomyces nigrescens TaxID=1920 RepID=A0A640TTS1_STRNI|nr:hypothetical protein Sliba_79460 [Streptomyces libani subsp. libani]GGV95987.1 hypothetical protein GCM10010500_37600 [Streptomyces libani subsp. libani]